MSVCLCVLFTSGASDSSDELHFSHVCFVENEVGAMDWTKYWKQDRNERQNIGKKKINKAKQDTHVKRIRLDLYAHFWSS